MQQETNKPQFRAHPGRCAEQGPMATNGEGSLDIGLG